MTGMTTIIDDIRKEIEEKTKTATCGTALILTTNDIDGLSNHDLSILKAEFPNLTIFADSRLDKDYVVENWVYT